MMTTKWFTPIIIFIKGIKTILWGCSIGKNNLTPAKIETLRKFSFIYARESLTADMLHRELGLTNVVTFPDPAFILKPQKCFLPPCFEKGCDRT